MTDHLTPEDVRIVQRFVILMYDRTSESFDVNENRRVLFTKKGRPVEGIPPTKDALTQHIRRAMLKPGLYWVH